MSLILVVDDLLNLAQQYAYDLKRVGGFDVIIATGGAQALEMISGEAVDCVILDLEMPGVDGFEVLRTMKERRIGIPVIVYTGTGDFDRCVKAVNLGAYGFIDKSESMERVALEVKNALERNRLEVEVKSLRQETGRGTPLTGSSRAMEDLREQIGRIAPFPGTVLVVGESGTGKELVARELHRLGPGEKTPFVAVNSAAFPENLIESELFGHERGAFTGASRLHRGAFERATGGTLFLDEIGELPLPAQAKLLRVLEEKKITRIGGEKSIGVDARVVTATNRDLESLQAEGRFRQDLYYRLNVHILRIPPLRERKSDIAELTDHFLRSICSGYGIREKKLDDGVLDLLSRYDWKRNNVRELRNIIERMIIASDAGLIQIGHVPAEVAGRGPAGKGPRTFQEMKSESERRIIISALERNGWQITTTAAELGLADHSSLLKIMRRHNIKRK
ncbi:MAG: sigma-54-dependent Fis family transcriptional regulator [Candidatus Krumholzibacteriota bacterium]|nr:sigma-54-dependent Fis family transcriptional regulator [Candidatus Krumholzibacteriota bacterium]